MKAFVYLMMAILAIGVVSAIPFPHPVYGTATVDGKVVSGLPITAKDLNTGQKFTTITDKKGNYQFEFTTDNDGHTIEFSVNGGSPTTKVLSSQPESFDLNFGKASIVGPLAALGVAIAAAGGGVYWAIRKKAAKKAKK